MTDSNSDKRDSLAQIKLIGAVLRLKEFTSAQLAQVANVEPETARSFVRADRGLGFVQQLGIIQSSKGRPAKLFRLVPEQRDRAIKMLLEHRHRLDEAIPDHRPTPQVDDEEELSPLTLLESAIDDLTCFGPSNNKYATEEWTQTLEDARIYLSGAENQLSNFLAGYQPAFERDLESRVINARKWLRRLEQRQELEPSAERIRTIRAPIESPSWPSFSTSQKYKDLLEPHAPRGVKWNNARHTTVLEPLFILLDGIRGKDPLSVQLIKKIKSSKFAVARIELAEIQKATRHAFLDALNFLRATTPIAQAHVVITIDSSTSPIEELAKELELLASPWRSPPDLLRKEYLSLHQQYDEQNHLHKLYIKKADKFRRETTRTKQELLEFKTLTKLSILSAMTMASIIDDLEASSASTSENEWDKMVSILADAANQAVGRVYCLDRTSNAKLKHRLSHELVAYYPKADNLDVEQLIQEFEASK